MLKNDNVFIIEETSTKLTDVELCGLMHLKLCQLGVVECDVFHHLQAIPIERIKVFKETKNMLCQIPIAETKFGEEGSLQSDTNSTCCVGTFGTTFVDGNKPREIRVNC